MHPFIVKRSQRVRRLRVTVFCDGNCTVTAPRGMDMGMIERFIRAKSSWIMKKLDTFKPFRPYIRVPRRSNVRRQERRAQYLEHRDHAHTFVQKKLVYWSGIYRDRGIATFTYHTVSVKDQKTRWGSCSRHGNLNFNYRIARIPEHLADYIVVHELCHLVEFNHSRAFWALVAQTMPEYKAYRRELQKHHMGIA